MFTSLRMTKIMFSTLFLVIFLLSNFQTQAFANQSNAQKIAAVLVVDVSGSMSESDSKNYNREAMKLFIDNMFESGEKVGVVPFDDKIIESNVVDLNSVDNKNQKQQLKNKIDSFKAVGDTDLSLGVNRAVKMLENNNSNTHSPLIILLADGVTDWDNISATEFNNRLNQSNARMKNAIQSASAKGIPIYTIMLNEKNKVPPKNQITLQEVANQTGGFYSKVKKANELPGIIEKIMANHRKVTAIPVTVKNGIAQFKIPNANVTEANISIIANKQNPDDIKPVLFNNKNAEVELTPKNGVILSQSSSKRYVHLKILRPAQGDWRIFVPKVPDEDIKVSLNFNYDLNLVLDPLSASEYPLNSSINIQAWLEDQGSKLQDPKYYDGTTAKLIVTNSTDSTLNSEEILTPGKGFVGTWQPPKEGQYSLKVEATSSSFTRYSQPVNVTIKPGVNPLPLPSDEGLPLWVYILIGLGVLVLAVAGYFLSRYLKARNKPFTGVISYEIVDEDGNRSAPQFRRLYQYAGSFTFYQLVGSNPDLQETIKIVFTHGPNDSLVIRNSSNCSVERLGRAIDARKGVEVKDKDRLTIRLSGGSQSVSFEYSIRG